MSLASDKVVIGKIGASYGVKGWVKINSYTDVPEGIFDYSPWILADGKEYQIDQWRPHGKALVAKLEGIDTRDDAERIKTWISPFRQSNFLNWKKANITGGS